MKTKILMANKQGIREAASIIKNGGVVAFPTETVYGLGADALNPEACKKIFYAKNRPADNPLIVHISKISSINKIVEDPNDVVKAIMRKFWPGSLSIILEAKKIVPNIVTANLNTVAVRMPDNAIAKELIELSGCYIAAPSANLSGKPSCTNYEHVLRDFEGKIDAVIAGGHCKIGLESTVINGLTDPIKILRPGGITLEMLKEVCDVVDASSYKGGDVLSPGMKHPHYKPKANVILIKNDRELKEKFYSVVDQLKSYAVFGLQESINTIDVKTAKIVEAKHHVKELAERLYSFFRDCDDNGIENIILIEVNKTGLGLAYMNRVNKAANKIR